MIINIESSSNSIFKNTKKLLTSSERRKTGRFIVEGYRIVADAIRHKADIDYIMVAAGYSQETYDDVCKVYRLSDKLFEEISSTVNSQGIIAVVNAPRPDAESIFGGDCRYVVYLDSVMDPGNMGTILRTCDAMGVDAVVASKGCVDIYNPKVVRSTMASIFNVPVYECDLTGKTVIVMGNEANGICDSVRELCTHRVTVPMLGGAESLNVAVCCGMILYEQLRQRKNMKGDI